MGSGISRSQDYWLLAWLKRNKISTVEQVNTIIDRPSGFAEMRKAAEQWENSASIDAPLGCNLAAGTGLRLDDTLTCPSPSCRRQQIDVLFRHAWHYFDRVLLPDGVGDLLRDRPSAWHDAYYRRMLLSRIDLVLHIQQLGAASLVHYYPKARLNFADEGAPGQHKRWLDGWQEARSTLTAEQFWDIVPTADGQADAHYSDPHLSVTVTFPMHESRVNRRKKGNNRGMRSQYVARTHGVSRRRSRSALLLRCCPG